jgi:hypothetical protein
MPRLARTPDALALRDAGWLVERADRLPDHARLHTRVAAARALVHADAADAFAWIAAQPDRRYLLSGLAESPEHLQWHLIDKTAARAWIESLPPDEHRIAFHTLPGAPCFAKPA